MARVPPDYTIDKTRAEALAKVKALEKFLTADHDIPDKDLYTQIRNVDCMLTNTIDMYARYGMNPLLDEKYMFNVGKFATT